MLTSFSTGEPQTFKKRRGGYYFHRCTPTAPVRLSFPPHFFRFETPPLRRPVGPAVPGTTRYVSTRLFFSPVCRPHVTCHCQARENRVVQSFLRRCPNLQKRNALDFSKIFWNFLRQNSMQAHFAFSLCINPENSSSNIISQNE